MSKRSNGNGGKKTTPSPVAILEFTPQDGAPLPPPEVLDAAAIEVASAVSELVGSPITASPLPDPTLESRVAALETALSRAQSLVNSQAAVIVRAAENATALRESRERCARLERKAEDARKAAGEAKKAYEAAVDEHFALERDLDSGQQPLPFGPDPAPEASAPAPDETTAGGDSEADWRGVPLGTLDLHPAIVAKLGEANLTTIGELSDYLAPSATGYCKRLTDIDGIGSAKAEQIERALERFWSERAEDLDVDVNQELLDGVEEAEAARPDAGNGEREDSEPDDSADETVEYGFTVSDPDEFDPTFGA